MSIFKNRTVIGVICILLALVICFGITPLFNQGISQKAEIVRVTKDIHAGELITRDMVTTAEVGSYNLPSGILREKDNVVGKYAKADLAVGDYILAAKLSDAPAAENAYLYNLDGTKQAISVTIKSFATGLSGKLQSGDIVSVIVADYPEDGETTIPAELQYVEIISVTASTGYPYAWPDAGELTAGGAFSLAWRCLDAQFWGVAQRRKRIFLLADFAGPLAPQLLFDVFGETENCGKEVT